MNNMPNEIYLLLKTALTTEEFNKVEKYINTMQSRIDDSIHYLNIMLPENEDAFYVQEILRGKYDAITCGRINYDKNTTYSDHIPRLD